MMMMMMIIAYTYRRRCGIPVGRRVPRVSGFLPRCMECRRGLAMGILSVCLSVCLSVKCGRYDKTEEK